MVVTASPSLATTLPLTTISTTPSAISPGFVAKTTPPPPVTAQRPTLVQQTAKSPLAVVPMNGGTSAPQAGAALATAPASAPVKPEPKSAAPTTTTPPPTAVASTGASTVASPSATPATKNEQLEKIQFAKKLLFHASTCTLSPGVCQVKKCDDVRRVFKHSVSCGGARSCSHCEQLKGLVKYHAKECVTGANEHCSIPFCDGLRRAYLSAAAALAAKTKTSLSSAASSSAAAKLGATSDDDDDNTPLSSAVSKAKKNSAKTKSPKASPTVKPTTASPVTSAAQASKKKSSSTAATVSKPTTPATTTATASASGSATAGAASKQAPAAKPVATANMTVEYGRLLQLILHVQKCTATECPVGEECAEAKTLLRQINFPNAPVRFLGELCRKTSAHLVCMMLTHTFFPNRHSREPRRTSRSTRTTKCVSQRTTRGRAPCARSACVRFFRLTARWLPLRRNLLLRMAAL